MDPIYYLDILILIAVSIVITYGVPIEFFTLFIGCLVIGMVLLNLYYFPILYSIRKNLTDFLNEYLEHMRSRR